MKRNFILPKCITSKKTRCIFTLLFFAIFVFVQLSVSNEKNRLLQQDDVDLSQVRLTLVVAYCIEDMTWMNAYFKDLNIQNVIIISKCLEEMNGFNPPGAKILRERNVGRRDHSYARWMADMKEEDATENHIVLFIKASRILYQPGMHYRPIQDMIRIAIGHGFSCEAKPHDKPIFYRTSILRSFQIAAHQGVNIKSQYESMGQWLDAMGINFPNQLTPVCYGGNFAVKASQIYSKKELWNRMIKSLARADNIEEGHFADRAWAGILSYTLNSDKNEMMQRGYFDDNKMIKDTLPFQDYKLNLHILKYPLKEVNCHLNTGKNTQPIIMHDTGIIKWVCNNGGEKQVTKVMLYVFNEYYTNEKKDNDAGHLMLDVGSNAGYFGLLAATYGLKTLAFDLQPECVAVIQNSILVNNLGENMRVIPKGVSEGNVNETTTIRVPDEGCNGRFPFADVKKSSKHIDVELHPLQYYLPSSSEIIEMMKVDTEGNEKRVLVGALPFFASQKIKNAIVEVTSGHGFWSKAGITAEEMSDVLIQIIDEYQYAMIPLVSKNYKIFQASMLRYVGAQNKTTILGEERIIFTDGKNATEYMLSDASPAQFDIWLLPSQYLHKLT